jgi:hypothetical protein
LLSKSYLAGKFKLVERNTSCSALFFEVEKINIRSFSLVSERTTPTERRLLDGEVSANFCG